jgi:hypothetical protein
LGHDEQHRQGQQHVAAVVYKTAAMVEADRVHGDQAGHAHEDDGTQQGQVEAHEDLLAALPNRRRIKNAAHRKTPGDGPAGAARCTASLVLVSVERAGTADAADAAASEAATALAAGAVAGAVAGAGAGGPGTSPDAEPGVTNGGALDGALKAGVAASAVPPGNGTDTARRGVPKGAPDLPSCVKAMSSTLG